MRWTEVTVRVPAESSEAVIAALLDAGSKGVSERDDDPRQITGCLSMDDDLQDRLDILEDRLAMLPEFDLSAPLDFNIRELDDVDWATAWKQHYKPLEIGERLVIKPSWESYLGDRSRAIVDLDPGMAFGTGGHPTTRLCLECLDRYVRPGMIVADIGTGSGILAIAAARLGAMTVHATDIDSLPRKIARENVTANTLDSTVIVHEMEGFNVEAQGCDLVVANILASVIVELLPSIRSRLNSEGLFIGSGIVEERLPDVMSALESEGFDPLEIRSDDIWRAVVARCRPAD
jgi:ribosomal protein L11 methyltransferase